MEVVVIVESNPVEKPAETGRWDRTPPRNPPGRGEALRFLMPAAGILLIAGFLLFYNLGSASFQNGDEATYAQCAREMSERGDYLTIYLRGEPFLEKPPVKIWLIALGYRLFGINEMGARFSSALFALGTIALTILLGRLLFGATAGLLAGVILLSSTQFIHEHCGRTAEMEPETAFLYVASMISLWLARRDGRWFYVFGASLGILAMTKGPLIIPVLAVAFLFLVFGRPRSSVTPRTTVFSILIFLAVAVPWHLHQLSVHGDLFRRGYLETHMLGRLTGNAEDGIAGHVIGLKAKPPVRYYSSVVFFSVFPWSLLILPALAHHLRQIWKRRSDAGKLLLLWIAVFALSIGVARGKLPWYAIPMLPALALSVAGLCRDLYRFRSHRLFFGLIGGALLLSLLFVPALQYDPYSRRAIIWPRRNQNLIPIWAVHTPDILTLLPTIATVTLIAAAVLTLLRSGRPFTSELGRRTLWIAFLCAFVFSGFYATALPLRGARQRKEIARCVDAVRAAGIRPDRIALLGSWARKCRTRMTDCFYLYSLSYEIHIGARIMAAPPDSILYGTGTLIVADHGFRGALSELGLGTPLCSGDHVDVFYSEGPR